MAHRNEELIRNNEELIRDFFEAFGRGDVDKLMNELFADDIVMYAPPGDNPLAGEYRGKEAVFDFFGKIGEVTGGTLRIDEIKDILANEKHAVALFRESAQLAGKTVESDVAEVYTLEDGKITSICAYIYDQATYDTVFPSDV